MPPYVSVETLYAWLIGLSLLALAGFITSRWVIPAVLRHLVSNFRVRSISARSIRGLFLKRGNITITLDRLGISFHSPTNTSARNIHVQVQGLVIKVANLASPLPAHQPKRKKPAPFGLTNFYAAPPLAFLAGFIPTRILWMLDAIMRPIIRRCFVAAVRTFIRLLPSLSQIVDVQLDSLTVVFEDLAEAYITISGVTVASKVQFSQIDDAQTQSMEQAVAEKIAREKEATRMGASYRERFVMGSRRVWERAWSITAGTASLSLRVEGITLSENSWDDRPGMRTRKISGNSMFLGRPTTPTARSFKESFTQGSMVESLTPGVAIAMTSAATVDFSIAFTTKSLESESLKTTVRVPPVLVCSRSVRSVLAKSGELRAERERNEAASDISRISPRIRRTIMDKIARRRRVRRKLNFESHTLSLLHCKGI